MTKIEKTIQVEPCISIPEDIRLLYGQVDNALQDIYNTFNKIREYYPLFYASTRLADSVVYFIQDSLTNLIKIGYTSKLKERHRAIQRGLGREAKIVASIPCHSEIALELEKTLHDEFKLKRVKGEWFSISIKDALISMTIYTNPYEYISFCNEKCDYFPFMRPNIYYIIGKAKGNKKDICQHGIATINCMTTKLTEFVDWYQALPKNRAQSLVWVSLEIISGQRKPIRDKDYYKFLQNKALSKLKLGTYHGRLLN